MLLNSAIHIKDATEGIKMHIYRQTCLLLYRCSQPSYNMYNNVAQHSMYYTKTHSVFLATVHDQSVTGHSEVSTCHRDHTSQQMLDFDVKNTVTQHSNMC